MFKKKYTFVLLLLLIVGICAVSSVSAADDLATNDTVASDDVATDDLSTNVDDELSETTVDEVDNQDVVSSDDTNAKASSNGSDDSLGYYEPYSDDYSVDIDPCYIDYGDGGYVFISINPCKTVNWYAYDFYIEIYSLDDEGYFDECLWRSPEQYKYENTYSLTYELSAYTLYNNLNGAGMYGIGVRNYRDDDLMDTAPLYYCYPPEIDDYGSGSQSIAPYDATISAHRGGTIDVEIDPCEYADCFSYDFYLEVWKPNFAGSGPVYTSAEIYSYTDYTSETVTIPGDKLAPGKYWVIARNYADDEVFDYYSELTVQQDSVTISAGNYNAYYYSGTTYTIKVTDRNNGGAYSGLKVKVVFSNSKTTVTKYYTTNAYGQISFVPPVGAGTYSVSISPASPNVQGSTVKRTATIKKSTVTMTTNKVSTYQGIKFTLRATVKSHGKNVNEGYVIFKINGKSYKVAVRNGVASKTIKINKVKKFRYTATYYGNNFNKKTVKNKANIKKRYNTKVSGPKSIKGYWNKYKRVTFTVKTKDGKKVKSGYLFIYDKTNGYLYYAKVKHGKAKFRFAYSGNYYAYGYQSYYFHKKAVTKYKIIYSPTSLKYKSSKMKFKKISIYKCPSCGKKKSHTHGSGWWTYYYYVS